MTIPHHSATLNVMELDVSDRADWPTLKSEAFDDGSLLILKYHQQDYQILLIKKGDAVLVELFRDWHLAFNRFNRLKEILK